MFFSKFDKIQYNGKTVTNITNSILLKYRPMNNTTLYTFHTVQDGETPLTLADRYYNNAQDAWVIILLNNVVDPYFSWALSTVELDAMIEGKYGEDNIGHIHHITNLDTGKFVDEVEQAEYVTDGVITTPLPAHYSPVTNAQYENDKNDKKREVKILAPRYLQNFKNDFEDLMNREGLL